MKRLLFKREFNTVILGKSNNQKQIISFITTTIIYLFVMGVVIFLFTGLVRGFSQYGLAQELLVIFLAFSVFIQIISGIKPVIKYLYQNQDYYILQPLPVKEADVIIVKMGVLYIRELLLSMILMLPIVIAYGIVINAKYSYYALLPLVLILIPIMPLSISVLFALPLIKINKLMDRFQIIKLFIGATFLIFVFLVYQDILNIIVGLMNENRLQFIFNVGNAEKMKRFASYLYPLNLFGKVLNGDRVVLNLFYIFLISVGLSILTVWFNQLNYEKSVKKVHIKNSLKAKPKHLLRKPNPISALYKKELLTVFRSRETAFSYISVLLTLPLIGYLLVSVINDVVIKMFGDTYLLPFVIMFIIILVGLCNSFVSTIISKEGEKLNILKTLPISFRKQVIVKIVFASIMLQVSLIITVLALIITDELSFLEGLLVWLITGFSSQSLIIGAVNLDLKRPDFKAQFYERKNSAFIFRTFIVGLFLSLSILIILIIVDFKTAIFFALTLSVLYMVLNISRLNRNIDEKVLRISL